MITLRIMGYRLVVVFCALAALATVAMPEAWAVFGGTRTVTENTFTTASAFGITYVKTIGPASCGGTTNVVTVPAGGVERGNTLLVRVALRSVDASPVTATDTQGNTYITTVDALNTTSGGFRVLVLQARIQTRLVEGDTITVTSPASAGQIVTVDEFLGVDPPPSVDATATGGDTSTSASASTTTNTARVLLYGSVVTSITTTSGPTDWTVTGSPTANCDGSGGALQSRGFYRIAAVAGTYTFGVSLGPPSEPWAANISAYTD